MTAFCNLDPANRRVEIGSTWLGRTAQRTGVNAAAKLLLLTRAFEDLDCIAVEFRAHWHNHQSREAIAASARNRTAFSASTPRSKTELSETRSSSPSPMTNGQPFASAFVPDSGSSRPPRVSPGLLMSPGVARLAGGSTRTASRADAQRVQIRRTENRSCALHTGVPPTRVTPRCRAG
jgi:hypothetical protein